jgi:hypothetical protein
MTAAPSVRLNNGLVLAVCSASLRSAQRRSAQAVAVSQAET